MGYLPGRFDDPDTFGGVRFTGVVADEARRRRLPVVRLTLAFESAAHANSALELLRGSGLQFTQVGDVESGVADGTGRVDIEVAAIDRTLIKTLVQGLRGSVLAEVGP